MTERAICMRKAVLLQGEARHVLMAFRTRMTDPASREVRGAQLNSSIWARARSSFLRSLWLSMSYDLVRHIQQEQWIFPLASLPRQPLVHACR